MEGAIEKVLMETASVMITYDSTKSNKIEFLLPNDKMAQLKLVTQQQQIEINKSIKGYTGDKNYIDWPMVGIGNALDIMDALDEYQQLEDVFFNRIDMHREKIALQLDGKDMNNLNAEWEHVIASELEKNHVFHAFESVIINRTKKTTVKNNNENKIHENVREKKMNNENYGVNIRSTDNIDVIFDECDMECKNIQNELEKRESEKCRPLDDSFGILFKTENMRLKLDEYLNDIKQKEFNLKQLETDDELDMNLKQHILIITNTIKVAEGNLLNNEIMIDERNENNNNQIKQCEIYIKHMNESLLNKEKEENEMNQELEKFVLDVQDLINDNVNYIFKMEKKMCQLQNAYKFNTIMFDNCLKNLDSEENLLNFQEKINNNNNFKRNIINNIVMELFNTQKTETNGQSNNKVTALYYAVPMAIGTIASAGSDSAGALPGGLAQIQELNKIERITILCSRNRITLIAIKINVQGWCNNKCHKLYDNG